ncbi:AAA family ATPase [Paraburkholderia steynii]|nr:AAA family ATPase [Paraburkholderia steynii]
MKIAVYRDDEPNPRFKRNQLITCLPAPLSDSAAQAALASAPPMRSKNFSRLPLEVRREYAFEVGEVFVAADAHIIAIRRLVEMLRNSYKYLMPSNAEFMRYICGNSSGGPETGPRSVGRIGPQGGGIIIGSTGSGKTSTVDRFESYVGEYGRIHTSFDGKPCLWPQIVTLRINAAGLRTQKQLAMAIADRLDRYLGGDEIHKIIVRSTDYAARLARILNSYLIGMLIVEDVQLWSRVDCRPRVAMLELLVGLVEADIPVICVGTILLQEVLESHTSLGEKLMALGQIPIPPVARGKEMHDLCRIMWQRRIACFAMEMPPWFPAEVLRLTAGLRRYVRELLIGLFQQMAEDRLKTISKKYLSDFAEVELSAIAPGVEIMNKAFRGIEVDRRLLKKYEEYIDSDAYKRAVAYRKATIRKFNSRPAANEATRKKCSA